MFFQEIFVEILGKQSRIIGEFNVFVVLLFIFDLFCKSVNCCILVGNCNNAFVKSDSLYPLLISRSLNCNTIFRKSTLLVQDIWYLFSSCNMKFLNIACLCCDSVGIY